MAANAPKGLHHYRHGGNLDDGWDDPADLRLVPRRDLGPDVWWAACAACDRTVEVRTMLEGRRWFAGHDCSPMPRRPEPTPEWDDTLDGQAEVQQRAWDRRPLTGMRGWTA